MNGKGEALMPEDHGITYVGGPGHGDEQIDSLDPAESISDQEAFIKSLQYDLGELKEEIMFTTATLDRQEKDYKNMSGQLTRAQAALAQAKLNLNQDNSPEEIGLPAQN